MKIHFSETIFNNSSANVKEPAFLIGAARDRCEPGLKFQGVARGARQREITL
ncbi:MAG: hypothetical protein WCS94_14270 [Verrucomicrobiota bacterium]